MISSRLQISAVAIVALLAASTARAADYSQPPPPPPIYYQPPPVIEEFSGWYLRGDIGFSNQQVGSLFNVNYADFNSVTNVNKSFDAAPLFGIGIGYYFNEWLRFDVTGEYRGAANFHGFDIGHVGALSAPDRYTASKSELTFLFNTYVDLGTWWKITPFVGAGVGTSRNTISNFGDVTLCTIPNCTKSDAYADSASQWNFAWALYAGLGYKVTKNFTVELAYRYLDLGNANSGDLIGYDGTNNYYNPMEFRHLTSHDLKLGVRFNLDGLYESARPLQYYAPPPQYYAPPPQPTYAPPPVYAPVYAPPPPPLNSKG